MPAHLLEGLVRKNDVGRHALLLGEPLHASMVAGGLVALGGVTLVNLPSRDGRAARAGN